MNANRFDTISKLLASGRTRRSAIAGGVGLATAGVVSRAAAQDGTPEVATPVVDPNDPHPSADEAQSGPELLFVQAFDAGTWAPKDGEDGVYTLTLTGAAANTIYFSDRPERIVGLWPNQEFLDRLGFTPENPPNAAIVAPREDGEGQEILVIELLNPVWDGNGTLAYDAVVLADYGEHGLAHLARQQQDYELGETFAAGGLFIDSYCSELDGECYYISDGEPHWVGQLDIGECFGAGTGICGKCNSDGRSDYYGRRCADKYPDQCFAGADPQTGNFTWDCYAHLTCWTDGNERKCVD